MNIIFNTTQYSEINAYELQATIRKHIDPDFDIEKDLGVQPNHKLPAYNCLAAVITVSDRTDRGPLLLKTQEYLYELYDKSFYTIGVLRTFLIKFENL